MGIAYGWYDEAKRIWIVEYDKDLTIDDIWQMADATYAMLDDLAPQPVYIISLIPDFLPIPKGVLSAIQSISAKTRSNERLHIFVSRGTLVRWLYNLRHLFTPKEDLRVADTLEEALALIDQTILAEAHSEAAPDQPMAH